MAARCVFCDIISGETPADMVLDEPHVLAFLDHRPLFPGHTLVAPKAHHVTLSDVPSADLGELFEAVQRLSVAVPQAVGKPGSFVANNNIVSQSVPHLHVHVVPRAPKDGLRGFFWPRSPYDSDAHRAQVAADIRAALGQ